MCSSISEGKTLTTASSAISTDGTYHSFCCIDVLKSDCCGRIMLGAGQENAANVSITVLKSLPDLQEKESRNTRFGCGGRLGGGRGGGFRNDRYSNNRSAGGSGGGRGRANRW
ncbi:hypothetical protein ACFX2C_039808 [Malus domestica]